MKYTISVQVRYVDIVRATSPYVLTTHFMPQWVKDFSIEYFTKL